MKFLKHRGRGSLQFLLTLLLLACGISAWGQIDTDRRLLAQGGYNQPLEGRGPLAAYAYVYWNEPNYPWTNITLRAAISPAYVDTELGFLNLLGPATSLGLGLAGGGFADSYADVQNGALNDAESFFGAGVEASVSVYHTFNPMPKGERPDSLTEVPLSLIVRNSFRGAFYSANDDTSPLFKVPNPQPTYGLITGLRWGGREPELFKDAFEISGWYELMARTRPQSYGYDNELQMESASQLFWGRILFARKFAKRARMELSLTGGSSVDPDRFSAYRLGGALPLGADFPLVIPGYYYQEISAQTFAVVAGQVLYPITQDGRFEVGVLGAAANVSYLEGMSLGQPWNSGIGCGLAYHSPSGAWHVLVGYGHGFNAPRNGERGANSLSLLVQYGFHKRSSDFQNLWRNLSPSNWRGISK